MHRGNEYKLEPVSISSCQLICNYLAVLPFEIFGAHGRNLDITCETKFASEIFLVIFNNNLIVRV